MFALFGYTFGGLSPVVAAGLGVVGAASLVALYLLRDRRRRVVVAFMPLWETGGVRRRGEQLGRRLRRWLSLLVQLLILGLLLFGLVEPRAAAEARDSRTVVMLLDRSASMQALDGGRRRWDAARQRAAEVIAGLAPSDRVMIAGFARTVTAESGFETDREVLSRALARMTPLEEPDDVERALAFADAALRGKAGPTVIVVGDGPYDASGVLVRSEVHLAPVGAPADNVALLSVAARRRALDPHTVDVGFVVHNFGQTPRTLDVDLLAGAERRLLERVSLPMAAGARAARTVSHAFTRESEIEARLVFRDGRGDALALDDRAFAVVPARPQRTILVVGGPNLYLEGALLSFGAALSFHRVPAGQAEAMRGEWGRFDVVVFDGVAPAPAPRAGRYLYLAPTGAGSPFPDGRAVRDPVPSSFDRGSPLLAQLSLSDLNIREARRLGVSSDDRVVVAALGTPLVVARERPGLRVVALAFDIRRSDLPLRPTFPLLLANTFDWLDRRADESTPGYRTGASLAGVVLTAQGVHRIQGPDGTVTVAANLADARESDRRPAPGLSVAGRPAPAWAVPATAPRRAWPAIALMVVVLVSMLEWAAYHRRWTV